MGQRTKSFTIAVVVTTLDLGVVMHSGPILWRVFGPVSSMRFVLFLLAGTGMFTLADIWSRSFKGYGHPLLPTEINEVGRADSLGNNKLEGADV
ncbi:hypothetical protein ACPOL_6151 [Acidisarcina polymorpha]|uniref:Uncharacterized protein n=1 Tax=Acidisarcina polymorpha TaxID=2211140 RepID=A0A2Z5G9Z7_9BACT|nr:hypothetical protein [Acidisarcina polymorpha]AXC15395.1 hypothetical protein ACPOL_6151 [Acidisarcina polymorpha]